jgi:hypothetical protein
MIYLYWLLGLGAAIAFGSVRGPADLRNRWALTAAACYVLVYFALAYFLDYAIVTDVASEDTEKAAAVAGYLQIASVIVATLGTLWLHHAFVHEYVTKPGEAAKAARAPSDAGL